MNPKSNQSTGVIALQRINPVKLNQARAMRKEMTDAEHILWQYLRNRECDGWKFRRQACEGSR